MGKYLLVVDLQKQFRDTEGGYEKCLQFIKDHQQDYQMVISTVFCQDERQNPNYRIHLNWDGCQTANVNDLEWLDPEKTVGRFTNADMVIHQTIIFSLTPSFGKTMKSISLDAIWMPA